MNLKPTRTHGMLALMAASLIGVAWWGMSREPSYQGRKLTEWRRDLLYDWGATRPQSEQALEAIRAIGPTAVPHLVKDLKGARSVTNSVPAPVAWIRKKLPFLKQPSTRGIEEASIIHALVALGPEGRTALPDLAKLLDHPTRAFQAIRALAGIGPEAVPTLIQALNHPDPNVHLVAAANLGLMGTNGTSTAIAPLLASLQTGTGVDRLASMSALTRIAPDTPAVTAATRLLLNDTDMQVRATAFNLAIQGTREETEQTDLLGKALGTLPCAHSNSQYWNMSCPACRVRSQALDRLDALGTQGQAALPHVLTAMNQAHPLMKMRFLKPVLRLDAKSTDWLPALRSMLGTGNLLTDQGVCRGLEACGTLAAEAVPVVLEQALQAESNRASPWWNALRAIDPGAQIVLPILAEKLPDLPPTRQGQVAGWLKQFAVNQTEAALQISSLRKEPRSLAAITAANRLESAVENWEARELQQVLDLAHGSDAAIRAKAVNELGRRARTHPELIEELIQASKDDAEEVRVQAVVTLTWHKAGLAEMLAAMEDPSAKVSRAAVERIYEYGAAASNAVPTLIRLATSEQRFDSAALSSLGRLRGVASDAIPALLGLLEHPDSTRRTRAAGALLRISPAHAAQTMPFLIEALKGTDATLRINVADVLGGAGATAAPALTALEQAAADKDPRVARAASRALESIRKAGQ